MCTVRSGVVVDLMGKFLVNLKCSELPSLPLKLDDNVTSMSGLAGNLGDAA